MSDDLLRCVYIHKITVTSNLSLVQRHPARTDTQSWVLKYSREVFETIKMQHYKRYCKQQQEVIECKNTPST